MINRIRLWLIELFLTVNSGQADPVKVAALVGILSTAGLFVVMFVYTVFTQSDLTYHVYVSPLPIYMGCKQVFDLMLGKHGWHSGAQWLLKPEQKAPDSGSAKPDFRLLALALVYIWGGFYLLRV